MGEGWLMATKDKDIKPKAPTPKTPAGKTVSDINAGINKITGGYSPAVTPANATGMFGGTGITGTDRNAAKEIEAYKLGYSKEYIASRGGINAQGYWNDVPLSGQLTAQEQKSVLLPNGTVNTQAMADILQKKQIAELVARGMSVEEATKKISAQYGIYGVKSSGSTGGTGGYDANGNPVAGGTYNADGTLATSSAAGVENNAVTNERRDAFAAIRKTLLTYGFTDAEMAEIDKYISSTLTNPRIGPEQAVIDMRALNAYKSRFAGNEARVKAGKNALSESDYLAQEDSYLQYLKAGGVDSLGNRGLYASLIGNAVAPEEVGKRINIAVNRVQNSDPEIKHQMQKFYPGITDKDIVAYFLNPEAALPELEKKATAAEIGAAAYGQGLNRGITDADIANYRKAAEDLAAYGIDRAGALEGYANIGAVLPTSQKLSSIYNEADIKYNQATGESEFFKSNADAAEKRRRLKSLERAAFSGDSGVSSQAGSLTRSTTGTY